MANHLQEAGESICPYLGLFKDPATALTYPSVESYCHMVKPIAVPNLDHQLSFCLTKYYPACRIFQSQVGQRMPEELANKVVSKRQNWFNVSYLWILVILAIIALIILFSSSHPEKQHENNAAISLAAPTETSFLLVGLTTEKATLGPALQTETPSPSPQPTPTATPLEIHKAHYLEEPFGKDQRFIVHQVSPGESLLFLATQYNTTPDILKAINYQLIVPIWVDSIIVIPIDRLELGNLPAFEAYQISESDITLRELAEKFAIDIEAIVSYNNIPADENLLVGEWVLIPRESNQ
ncbi:MAG TPA: hypothetical protein DCG78_06990 [Anaerolineaceae bacterium]|nr:hypothetical protein [Anaerolineaceae bacterium]